jgi:hypothetical protein
MSLYLRGNHRQLQTFLPQIKGELILGLTKDTFKKTLLDDLKTFTDAVIKLLGDDFFLRTSRRERWNLVLRQFLDAPAGDWRALANKIRGNE